MSAVNLAWKYHWFRQSELEGALLLGRMIGLVEDADLIRSLTQHCAEEAEHSRIWSNVIAELDLPTVRIFRSYQSFYLEHSGPPGCLLSVLSFTHVFERRVHRRFHEEMHRADTPGVARRAFARMIEDEKGHLSWVAEWLRQQPGADAELRRFERIDRQVFAELQPFEQCIWNIPRLGRDCAAPALVASETI